MSWPSKMIFPTIRPYRSRSTLLGRQAVQLGRSWPRVEPSRRDRRTSWTPAPYPSSPGAGSFSALANHSPDPASRLTLDPRADTTMDRSSPRARGKTDAWAPRIYPDAPIPPRTREDRQTYRGSVFWRTHPPARAGRPLSFRSEERKLATAPSPRARGKTPSADPPPPGWPSSPVSGGKRNARDERPHSQQGHHARPCQ